MARLGEGKPQSTRGDPVNFTPPIDVVRDSYADRVRAAKEKTSALKGKGKPLGGAPPIPEGKLGKLTMKQPVFDDEPPKTAGVPPPTAGVGSAYGVNQRMAAGEFDGPVSMAEAMKQKRQLSQQTEEALKVMDQNMKALESEQEPPKPDLEEPEAKDDKDELARADKELERAAIDVNGVVHARNSLLREERRKVIEARLEPLDFADMVTKREVQQNVPVVPGRMEFLFRTLSQTENIFCLQYVYEFPGSEAYVNELLNTAKLVCSTVAINGAMLPNHMKDGSVDREGFQRKWDQVVSFPVQLVGDMSVQLIWFNNRVNRLFDIDNLKNG